jgi:hypothetical protein
MDPEEAFGGEDERVVMMAEEVPKRRDDGERKVFEVEEES